MFAFLLEKIYTFCSFPTDFSQNTALPDWIIDAIQDSVYLIPFLFIAFLIIEFIEYYHAEKVNSLLNKNKIQGVVVGTLAALFPQCGFSVMAASLYSRRIITKGTLVAIFLVTSDETIPILLAIPSKTFLIIPILLSKFIIGILSGLLIDFIFGKTSKISTGENFIEIEEGCCKHDIENGYRRELLIHPLIHTFNVFCFILIITLIINFVLSTNIEITFCENKFLQPLFAAIVGLIPNCAVSVCVTMMLTKSTIAFGTAISALLANAGLGLLVLLKNNDFKDTLNIVVILVIISATCGVVINCF